MEAMRAVVLVTCVISILILFHLPPFLRHQTANPPALLGSQVPPVTVVK